MANQSSNKAITWEALLSLLHKEFGTNAMISQTAHSPVQAGTTASRFEALLGAARDHMAGPQCTIAAYMASHADQAAAWQTAVFGYLLSRPGSSIQIYSRAKHEIWDIKMLGDCVQFGMPAHGFGGENTWLTCDGLVLYLIDAS